MTTKNTHSHNHPQPVDNVPADNPAPKPVSTYEVGAANALAAIDSLAQTIPFYVEYNPEMPRPARRLINVSDEFLISAVDAARAHGELNSLSDVSAEMANDRVEYIRWYRAVARRARAFADSVEFTLDGQKSIVSTGCRQFYRVAKAAVRTVTGTALALHVEAMRNSLGFAGRKHTAKAKNTPQPAPAAEIPFQEVKKAA